MELGLGHSALQLYFYDRHPRAGSGICSGFLSEKVDTEEHLDGKQPFVSALCAAWAETMLDLRTFVRSPAPSGAFMEILPFLSRYEQREAAVSEGVAGVQSFVLLLSPPCWVLARWTTARCGLELEHYQLQFDAELCSGPPSARTPD